MPALVRDPLSLMCSQNRTCSRFLRDSSLFLLSPIPITRPLVDAPLHSGSAFLPRSYCFTMILVAEWVGNGADNNTSEERGARETQSPSHGGPTVAEGEGTRRAGLEEDKMKEEEECMDCGRKAGLGIEGGGDHCQVAGQDSSAGIRGLDADGGIFHSRSGVGDDGQDVIPRAKEYQAPCDTSSPSLHPCSLPPCFLSPSLHQAVHDPSDPQISTSRDYHDSTCTATSHADGEGGSSLFSLGANEENLSHCVVCLETLAGLPPSPSASPSLPPLSPPILITACNHAFHIPCLGQVPSPLCPVCRYNHDDALAHHSSACTDCGRTTDLWVCLVCAYVGCGRYHAHHSRNHYLATLHAYAIEVQTQQVWDYVGDGYVHRLLYHPYSAGGESGGEGGKIVEVPDPNTNSNQRPRHAPMPEAMEEEMVHRKLENWAEQYTVLLSTGLQEQQTRFDARLAALRTAFSPSYRTSSSGATVVAALRQEKRQMEKRCAGARERLRKVREEVGFLSAVNASLEANQESVAASLREAQEELMKTEKERETMVGPLEERLRQLMMRLDCQIGDGSESKAQGDHGVQEAKERGCGEAGGDSGDRRQGKETEED